MPKARILTWCRLLVGAGFMYLGVSHILSMHEMAALFTEHGGWHVVPFVGGMRPYELTLWLAFVELFLGVFVFGGLFTRVLGAVAVLVAGFQVFALGLAGGLVAPLLAVGAAVVVARGAGGGTMESALGKMQRRSIERQRERDEERRLEREAKRRTAEAATSEQV